MRAEDTVLGQQRAAGRGDERGEPLEELQGVQQQRCGAITPRPAQLIEELAARALGQSLERQRSTEQKHEIPAILRSGGGAIVNNASIAGSLGMAGIGLYVASKHAVIGLSKVAALEFSKTGVRVNTVSPAAIETDMYARFTGALGGDQARDSLKAQHPIGRVGRPVDVAEAVAWLCSDTAA
jgi:NAD(P)-dependent dehydrogenase (short-subunit alcohol dehydrogenase family)